jgi:hypothetical protein
MTRLMNIILKSLAAVLEASGNYRGANRIHRQRRSTAAVIATSSGAA